MEAAEPGGAVTCLDLCPAAQVAFDQLGHGGEFQSFPVPLAVSFPQPRLTLGSKGGGAMVMEGGTPGSSAVLVLPLGEGVGHLELGWGILQGVWEVSLSWGGMGRVL